LKEEKTSFLSSKFGYESDALNGFKLATLGINEHLSYSVSFNLHFTLIFVVSF